MLDSLCPLGQLYIHHDNSALVNVQLKNLSIYPTECTITSMSDLVLDWANVNFQPIGKSRRRVWQFQGAGFTNQNSVEIIYSIGTPTQIEFEDNLSGVITSSEFSGALDASRIAQIAYSITNNESIIKIIISLDQPLKFFQYEIYKNDFNCQQNFWTKLACAFDCSDC